MRAAIYARVSSQVQRDRHTIASQLSTLPAFVAERGWTLVQPPHTYVDDGRTAKSGHLAAREAFARLLADARKRLFDVVAVVDLDRLTRAEDLRERGEVLGAFQTAGVQIAVASTGQVLDLSSSVGDLMSSLGAFFAAEENRKRRDRSVRGKIEAIRRGKKPSGPTPFGYQYDRNTGQWAIDEQLGPVVVELFKRVAAGETCQALALNLATRGIPRARPSKAGNRQPGHWSRARVNQIVRCRTYLGEWVADKHKKLSVSVPRLVSDDLFELADQRLLQVGKRGMAKTRNFHLAQGIAGCGICGGLICCSGTYSRKHKRRLHYYICTNRLRPKGERCTLPMMRTDAIDAQLWAAVSDMFQRPDLLEMSLRAQGQSSSASAVDWEKDQRDFGKKLARLNQTDRVILERFTHDLISKEVMDDHLKKSSRERKMLERQIAVAESQAKAARSRKHVVAGFQASIDALRSRVHSATGAERQQIVRMLVPDGAIVMDGKQVRASVSLVPEIIRSEVLQPTKVPLSGR